MPALLFMWFSPVIPPPNSILLVNLAQWTEFGVCRSIFCLKQPRQGTLKCQLESKMSDLLTCGECSYLSGRFGYGQTASDVRATLAPFSEIHSSFCAVLSSKDSGIQSGQEVNNTLVSADGLMKQTYPPLIQKHLMPHQL